MDPRIRYAKTSDGVSIAYWAMGSGPRLLVSPPMLFSHLTLEWQSPPLRAWYEELARERTVVRWDPRGYGLSDRGTSGPLVGGTLDIEAVLDRVPGGECDVVATSHQGNSAIEYAASHPGAVEKLVIFQPMLRGEPFTQERSRALRDLAGQDETLFSESLARSILGWESGRPAHLFAEFIRAAVNRDDVQRFAQEMSRYDGMSILPNVRSRTLVVYISSSLPTSEWTRQHARDVAATIPDAELLELEGGAGLRVVSTHAAGREAVAEFLGLGSGETRSVDPAAPALPSGLTVILFADIVDSTALTERLGDAPFRERARDLEGSLRTIIRDAGGTPIEGKLLGDGVLATFTSARQAIEAALRCGTAGDDCGLPLHLGLHAGDVIREDNNVYGGAVNIAARIAAESRPGEVLVSQTVRDLARTSAGVAFEDRGERELKGVSEPVRMWAVKLS